MAQGQDSLSFSQLVASLLLERCLAGFRGEGSRADPSNPKERTPPSPQNWLHLTRSDISPRFTRNEHLLPHPVTLGTPVIVQWLMLDREQRHLLSLSFSLAEKQAQTGPKACEFVASLSGRALSSVEVTI